VVSKAPHIKELLESLIEINQADTMLGIYERLTPGKDGHIRTVLSPGATDTGRFGSAGTFLEPSTNLQNLPKKTAKRDPAYNVRSVIIPSDGMVLVEADLSSAERRLLAYLAEDARALGQIMAGINSYKWFASKMFDIKYYDSIPKDSAMYHIGKMSVLALDRGVSWKTLKDQINGSADLTGATITAKRAKEAVTLFHQLYPGYRSYALKIGSDIKQQGYLVNVCGRKRHFFNRIRSESEWNTTVREGVSFMAQAIGDILNDRLAEIYERLDPGVLQILMQNHDAILWETTEDRVHSSCRAVKEILEKPIRLPRRTIVIPAEFSYSRNSWGEMKEYPI